MTSIFPIVSPALPTVPVAASLASIDTSVVLLPLVLVLAIAVGTLLERAFAVRGGSRARRAFAVVPIRRAA
jgi:hypothetical protein